jgi:hypothetical protein
LDFWVVMLIRLILTIGSCDQDQLLKSVDITNSRKIVGHNVIGSKLNGKSRTNRVNTDTNQSNSHQLRRTSNPTDGI